MKFTLAEIFCAGVEVVVAFNRSVYCLFFTCPTMCISIAFHTGEDCTLCVTCASACTNPDID